MNQSYLIGILQSTKALNETNVQSGLHYAREVIFVNADADQELPPVGRGKAVAGLKGGKVQIGKIDLYWGSAIENITLDRPCLVVAGKPSPKTLELLNKAHKMGREVHVCDAKEPIRVVATDATRTAIQICKHEKWIDFNSSLPQPTPAPKKLKISKSGKK